MGKIAHYLAAIFALNLVWESLQLPLYTIWTNAPVADIAWAVIHCTVGDLLIGGAALTLGWLVAGRPRLTPAVPLSLVTVAILTGIALTIVSEWLATQITRAWEYSPLMPIIPGIRVGLSPLLQWSILPPIAMRLVFGWLGGSTREP